MSNQTWTWIVLACAFILTVVTLAILNTWIVGRRFRVMPARSRRHSLSGVWSGPMVPMPDHVPIALGADIAPSIGPEVPCVPMVCGIGRPSSVDWAS